MVTTRGVLHVAGLCSLALSLLPALEAKRPTLAPTTTTVCRNSEGNKRFGVEAINDASCVKGGLGCFDNHCRYCRVLDTPKSSHLNTCLSYGVVFTSTTPMTVAQGPCTVSSGDVAAGISSVTDSSCLKGGLGCYNDHCRYCKITETKQSSGFMACSTLDSSYNTLAPITASPTTTTRTAAPTNAPTTTAPTVAPTDAPTTLPPAVAEPTTDAPTTIVDVPTTTPTVVVEPVTEAPTVIVDVPTATPTEVPTTIVDVSTSTPTVTEAPTAFVDVPTATPTVTEAPTAIVDVPTATPTSTAAVTPTLPSTCTIVPSVGDVDAGVNIVTDLSCVVGGLGCLSDVCRFCKVKTTPQSDTYMDCALVNGEPTPTTEPPVIDTIAPTIPDVTTEAPVITPVETVTPKVRDATVETPASTTEVPVATVETPASTTEVPVATVESPASTTVAPDVVTETPALTTEVPVATAESPASTTVAPDVVTETPALTTEVPVATVESPTSTTVAPDVVTETPAPTTEVPVATVESPASTTEIPVVPDATTETPIIPVATTEAPIGSDVPVTPTDIPVDAPTTTTATEIPDLTTGAPVTTCTLVSSADDVELGISVGTDPSCSLGGVGCIDDICRFCKLTTTLQSSLYVDCASLGNGSQSSSTGEAPTEVPDATSETPVTTDTPDATTEAPITFTDVVTTETPADTPTVAPVTTDTPVSTTAIPVVSTEAPAQTKCGIVAAEGDIAVGIHIATDASCSTGGVGCINDLCRFCKVEVSPQSEAFVDCSTLSGISDTAAPVDISTTAPVSPAPTGTCDLVASSGDAAVGIRVVTDASCSAGGVGCINDLCRFCKVITSVQSAAFNDCVTVDGYTSETEAPTTVTPVVSVPSTTCTQAASDGDLAVGVDITTDTSCLVGGVGCIDTVCRFCQTAATSQSAAFPICTTIAGYTSRPVVPVDTPLTTDAPVEQATCSLVVSAGDAANGISITGDAACEAGGVGCIDNVCRFCKVTTTIQSAGFVECTSIAGFTLATNAPTDTTPTSADTITPAATCGLVVAEGDAAVGINIIADLTCQFGGVGCIDNACRFCKVRTTDQSAAFIDCPIAVVPTATSPVVVPDATTAPTNTGVDTSDIPPNDTSVPVDTEAPGTDFVTKSPDATSDTPVTTSTDSSTSSSAGVTNTGSDAVTDRPTITTSGTNTPSDAVDTIVPGSDGTALTKAPVVDTQSPSSSSISNGSTTSPRTEKPTAAVDTSDLLTDAPVGTAAPSTNAPVSDVDVDDIDWDGSGELDEESDSTYLDSEESTDGLDA